MEEIIQATNLDAIDYSQQRDEMQPLQNFDQSSQVDALSLQVDGKVMPLFYKIKYKDVKQSDGSILRVPFIEKDMRKLEIMVDDISKSFCTPYQKANLDLLLDSLFEIQALEYETGLDLTPTWNNLAGLFIATINISRSGGDPMRTIKSMNVKQTIARHYDVQKSQPKTFGLF